jgi:hypothetical protein
MIVIVLDTLDECGTPNECEALLDVLTYSFTNLPAKIHTVIMSRADIDIQNAFESQHHILVYELDIRLPGNSDNILLYFRHRMKLVRTKNRHLRLGVDWPGEEVLHQLVQRASGLFVWAFTASEFINGHAPKKHLDIVLSGDVVLGAEAALDALYKTALTSVGCWNDKDFVDDFWAILGTILVVCQPLSCAAIDALLHLPDDTSSMHTHSLIGCLLQQNPTIHILHPLFTDFLMTKEWCNHNIWFKAMSILKRLRDAIQILDRLMDWILVSHPVVAIFLCPDLLVTGSPVSQHDLANASSY